MPAAGNPFCRRSALGLTWDHTVGCQQFGTAAELLGHAWWDGTEQGGFSLPKAAANLWDINTFCDLC